MRDRDVAKWKAIKSNNPQHWAMYKRLRNRVLKWWRHKNEISEIMGFVRIFWKNNVQEAYLPRMSISEQIVSEMLACYTLKSPYKPF